MLFPIKRPRQFGFDGGVKALREDRTEGNGEMNLFHEAGQLYAMPPKIVDSGLAKCQNMYMPSYVRTRETSLDNAKQWLGPGPASSGGGVHQLQSQS